VAEPDLTAHARVVVPDRVPPASAWARLGLAFVTRQTNLWKRYWGWELVWLAYGVVNTLAITFIAEQVGREGIATPEEVRHLILFLLLGTLVWAYLSAVLDDTSLVITWERWEGTIEHTLMAPVPRPVHLLGMSAFAVLHASLRTLLILALAMPFFEIDLTGADWVSAATVLAVGSVSLVGLGMLVGILPLLYPERGDQMSFVAQAFVLLVSGVYYSVEVLPGWLQAIAWWSPATYLLEGVRGAVIEGRSVGELARTLWMLALFGAVLVPVGLWAFGLAERWAKRTGRLKRHG
jgi:ABC-2 type transport system permease protein